jgi:hypothetical protein
MPNFMTADSASAPALAAWVESVLVARGLSASSFGENFARAMWRWHNEAQRVHVGTVDHTATLLGYHLSELPRTIWLRGGARGPRPKAHA